MRLARAILVGWMALVMMVAGGYAEETDAARVKELLAKKKAGQELTPQEREFLEQNVKFLKKTVKGDDPLADRRKGDRLAPADGGPEAGAPRGHMVGELQALLNPLNVVDRASLTAVQQLWQGGKRDEAVAAAEKTAGVTPDPEAAGVARLLIGRFLMELGKKEEAAKSLHAVTGHAAALAMVELAEPLVRAKDLPGLLAAFKDLVASQKNGLDRCRVAKALLDYLDRPMPEGLSADQRAALLQAVAASIPYAEAIAAKEELAKEQPPPVPPGQPVFGPMAQGGPQNGPAIPPEFQERMRAMRDLPPEQRQEAIGKLMKDVAKQIEQLEAAGRADEARRLREILERHQQMEGRMKDMMMKKNKARVTEGRRDPAELRAEIKRLQDQGFMEEAKKLQLELEATERGQAVDEKF